MFLSTFNRLIILLGMAVMAVAPVSAQRYDLYSLADSVTIGERFQIVLSIEHDGSRAAIFPDDFLPDSLKSGSFYNLGGFTIVGRSGGGRRTISRNWVIDSLLYEVATFELDSAYVQTLPVGLISDSDTLIAGTPSLLVPVISLVPEGAEGIRDITPLAEFPRISWLWYAIPILLALALAYWFWKRRQELEDGASGEPELEPEEPPYDEALKRLRELERMNLKDPEIIKPFYVELSALLRTYLNRRADVPALETTTRELIQNLQESMDSGLVPEEMIAEIREILLHADLVKFADMHPASDAGVSAIDMTRHTIDETEREYESRQAPVVEPGEETDLQNEVFETDVENSVNDGMEALSEPTSNERD